MTTDARGRLQLCLAVALLIVACSGDGTGPQQRAPDLEVSSTSPTAGSTEVETAAVVAATFDRAVDPATVTEETFRIRQGGVALPAAVSYDAATRTATAVVPLLPGETYQAEVTTGVRTATDGGLSAAEQWSFTTRAWEVLALDDAGSHHSLVLDGSGGLHIGYWRPGGAVGYATCAGECATAADWPYVTVDAGGAVYEGTSLTVDASGGIHIGYYDHRSGELGYSYATCATECTTAANWDTVTVAAMTSYTTDYLDAYDLFTSVGAAPDGQVHVSFWDYSLFHSTCEADCTTAANWQTGPLEVATEEGWSTSLLVDETGAAHAAYRPYADIVGLKYATCATFGGGICSTGSGASWPNQTADEIGGRSASLAIDALGGLHVSHYSDDEGLRYSTCSEACLSSGNWQSTTVTADLRVVPFTALAVDGNGRLHVAVGGAGVDYATCAVDCATAANWRTAPVDDEGEWVSVAVGENGRVHMTFSRGNLSYVH